MSKKRKCNLARMVFGTLAGLVVIIGMAVAGFNMHNGKVYHSIPQ